MRGFAYGADDFDAGLSEAIDRARTLLRNIYEGGMSTSRPAHSTPGHGPFGGPGRGPFGAPGARPVRRTGARPIRRPASRAGRGCRRGLRPRPGEEFGRGHHAHGGPGHPGEHGHARHHEHAEPGFDDDEGPGREEDAGPGAARGAAVSGRTGPRSSAARARAGGKAAADVAVPARRSRMAWRTWGARRAAWPRRPGWAAAAEGVPGRRARHDPCAADRRTADGLPDHVRHRGAQPGGLAAEPGCGLPGSAAAGRRGPDHRRRGGRPAHLQPHRRGPRICRGQP